MSVKEELYEIRQVEHVAHGAGGSVEHDPHLLVLVHAQDLRVASLPNVEHVRPSAVLHLQLACALLRVLRYVQGEVDSVGEGAKGLCFLELFHFFLWHRLCSVYCSQPAFSTTDHDDLLQRREVRRRNALDQLLAHRTVREDAKCAKSSSERPTQ